MMPYIAVTLTLIALGIAGLFLRAFVNPASSTPSESQPPASAERYRPMLRLLQETPLAGDARAFRARRRAIFRGYLRCLRKDYSRILSGLRAVMVESSVDRPDLASAIRESQMNFAIAMVRIELGLWRHAAGIGTVDLSPLVQAMDRLCSVAPRLNSIALSA